MLGVAMEARAFSPHLTLGRVREPRRDWTAALAEARPADPVARFTVDRVLVVESRLDPRGSVYTVRARAALTAAGLPADAPDHSAPFD